MRVKECKPTLVQGIIFNPLQSVGDSILDVYKIFMAFSVRRNWKADTQCRTRAEIIFAHITIAGSINH